MCPAFTHMCIFRACVHVHMQSKEQGSAEGATRLSKSGMPLHSVLMMPVPGKKGADAISNVFDMTRQGPVGN